MKIENVFQAISQVFLDTAPVIYYVEATEGFTEIIREVFRLLAEENFHAVTSPVTLAECLIVPVKMKQIEFQQAFIDLLTNSEEIAFTITDSEISKLAAEIRVKYNLKLPDALQIATALQTRCDAFLTNDKVLKRVKELRVLVLDELEI
ncbi:MAG: type II toxin-antitoxin system VapC family toxin [Waterburya sp.]